jgi:type II secretion system protein N
MPRILKFIAYLVLFVVSFLIFLYWMFPYDILKDRVASAIEEPLGRAVEVSIGELRPYYFTGVSISNLSLTSRTAGESTPLAEFEKVRVRATLFSLLLGNPRVSFFIQSGKGEIAGSARQTEEGFDISVDLDNFDVGSIKWLESQVGLKLGGRLGGSVDLKIDRLRPVRTTGKIDLSFDDFKVAASQVTIGEVNIPIPDAVLTKGRGSRLKLSIDKGAVNVDEFRLADGDLQLDVKGKIFLSTVLSNYRLNLTGSFRVSDKLSEAFPLLFMAEKQKQPDGSYPLTVSGRLSEPSIKIGTFTLPL